jgi:putative membrane protein insertion efficiency factor
MPAEWGCQPPPRRVYREPARRGRCGAQPGATPLARGRRCGYASACPHRARLCHRRPGGDATPSVRRAGTGSRDGLAAARDVARQGRFEGELKDFMGIAASTLRGLIRFYQLCLSHFSTGSCRYLPSCSDYAMEAVTVHGALRGGWLGLCRILRCHPWGGDGYDPVPVPRHGACGCCAKTHDSALPTAGSR